MLSKSQTITHIHLIYITDILYSSGFQIFWSQDTFILLKFIMGLKFFCGFYLSIFTELKLRKFKNTNYFLKNNRFQVSRNYIKKKKEEETCIFQKQLLRRMESFFNIYLKRFFYLLCIQSLAISHDMVPLEKPTVHL